MLLTYQRSMLMAAMAVAGSVAGVLLFDGPAIAQPEWKEVPLKDGTYRQYQATHRTDTVDIAAPNRLTSEFHGHTDRAPGTTGTLIFYRKGAGGTENGSLIAPFDGIHGWYLKNDTDRPVVVRLTLAGFYEVIPNQLPN